MVTGVFSSMHPAFSMERDPIRADGAQWKSKSARTVAPAATGDSAAVDEAVKQLEETTGQIVGSLFYGTMLRAMRESEIKGEYGHGGRGEEIFAAQLDGILAERAGVSTGRSLGDTLFKRLANQQSLIAQGALDTAG